MATVYLAEDLKHKRKVALKVLKPELAAVLGAERFVQEITTTAALQHPHILPLFDSGTADGFLYYVMPFIQGETLRTKLDRETQLGIDEAVRITTAVADALDYAHRQGVIHRDIKPENILLHEGRPMVADFGIALAVSAAAGGRMTETGLSLGTPHYMSPEQATAEKEISARSDVYSLASVLYEMLAGQPPHLGGSAQQIIMKIIAEPVEPVTRYRKSVPPHVADALAQALEKLPADRFPTAAAFAEALQHAGSGSARRGSIRPVGRASRRDRTTTVVVAALAMAAGLGIGATLRGGTDPPPAESRRLNLMLPDNAPLALTGPGPLGIWQLAIALSPSGDQLAYASPQGGTTMLALRPLDRDSAVILPGTEGAYHPVFSPDGQWIAYFAGAELRKVLVSGGSPITITTVERPVGAIWHQPDELILFQQDGFQMRRVSASGGRDSVVVLPAPFGAASVLPGGAWVVGHLGSGQLALLSLADATIMAITGRGVIPVDSVHIADLLFGASPKYVTSGHLVFGAGDGALMALPFDAATRQVRGVAVPVADGVRTEEGFGFAQYALTPDGTLIYVPGRNQLFGHLVSIRPEGGFDTMPLPRGPYTQPRMSPDGSRLAVHVRKAVGGWEILILDLETAVPQRIQVEGDFRAYPGSWMPDGTQLMVGLFRPVGNTFLGARMYTFADRSWEDLPRFDGSYMSISPTGGEFVYSNWRTGDLFIRSLRGDTTSTPIPARGTTASFSPDSRWLSWGGADGRVAVSPLPPTGAIHTVAERGQQPLWAPDGRRLIYRDGRQYFEVTIETAGGFRTGRPRLVAEGSFIRTFAWNHTMMPNGRLVAMVATPGDATRELRVITGFPALLARRAPAQVAP
jgi:serine/threonine-protein kinase